MIESFTLSLLAYESHREDHSSSNLLTISNNSGLRYGNDLQEKIRYFQVFFVKNGKVLRSMGQARQTP